MKKYFPAAKKQFSTLALGCALVALVALALINCTDPAAPTKYTVTFDTNGGNPAVKDKTVENGKLLAKPATEPSKEGFSFVGWYKDQALTQVFDFSTEKITADITLYAKWIETYTVTFDSNGGIPAVADKTVEAGKTLAKPTPNPTKTGFVFAGWYKDKVLTQTFNFSTEKITADITLYAKWIETYTVTFDANGGSNADPQSIESGKKASRPSDPTKTDSSFAGWYTDQALTQAFDFDTETITADITLYAKWVPEGTAVTYTVTFNANGGTNVNQQSVVSGEKASRPADPIKTDSTFAGWFNDQALTQAFDFNANTITQDTTLYAKWESNLVDIPDANFRARLKTLIPGAFVGEQLNAKSPDVTEREELNIPSNDGESNSLKIKSLEGIRYFTKLKRLVCSFHNLTSLDMSNHTQLTDLNCGYNDLTKIDVSNHTQLTRLTCDNNSLTVLDVSNNTQLTRLTCNNNSLTALDVSNHTQLAVLICGGNNLSALDVSNHTQLTDLNCGSNNLTVLDVSNHTQLTVLYCGYNKLTTLDVSNNTALTFLNCQKNRLTHLDMRGMRSVGLGLSIHAATSETNGIKTLKIHENLKNRAQIKALKTARGNQVTIATYSAAERSTAYTLVCGNYNPNTDACLVEIPDAAFRTKLKASIPDAFEGEKLNPTSDKVTGLKTLNVVSSSIKDLTGIQYFTALTELICDNNMLTSLDISKNKKVKKLNCSENQLTSLDVSKNTALTELICHNNSLASLDVSKNTALITLHSYDNRLTSLDLSKNRALTSFSCSKNQLTSLDIRGMRSVVILGIQADTDETNAINTLKVHENLKAHAQIKALKTARGDKVTIETYSASGTSYTLVCSDYDPTAGSEVDRCGDELKHTVVFNSREGSLVDTLYLYYEGLISRPVTPTKADSVFVGWYKDAGLTQAFDFNADNITQNTTLYARWASNKLTKANKHLLSRVDANGKTIITEGVVSIGERAFYGNDLTAVALPNSLTEIGLQAFRYNELTSVNLPDSLTSIRGSAFADNELTSVIIPEGVTRVRGGAFQNNDLTSVTIPEGVTTIGSKAFQNNKLTSVNLPDSLTAIGDNAFDDNGLTSVTIPEGVIAVNSYAFTTNPDLETVTLSEALYNAIVQGTTVEVDFGGRTTINVSHTGLDDAFGSQVTTYQTHEGTRLN